MIETLIQRRVTTAMIFLGVCLLGIISLYRLPVQLLPDIEYPTLTIVTPYQGAPPSEIEQLVTRRIEEAAGSVSGVKEIRSDSLEGLSLVTVRFNWKTSMDFALIETKEKVDIIKGELPQDAGKSIVVKYDPSSEPVMICTVESKESDFKKLRKRIEREIIPSLERTEGVALVDINGGYKRQINVNLDSARLYSYGLSIGEIVQAIGSANYNFPAGTIEKGNKEYTVRTIGEFGGVSDIGRVVIGRNESGVPIYLSETASVEDGYRERKCIIRLDGKEVVGLLIHKEPGKNTIVTCQKTRERIEHLQAKYNNDMTMRIIYDQSKFVQNSVDNVFNAAIIGGLFALLVLWFFLGDTRSALIIAASIPVSVLGSFALMYFSGISLNVMSLGGLALGVGMMVDAGIVVLESISLKKAENPGSDGPSTLRLILEGVREVKISVIASAVTTLVVFLPILFISGITGALFGQLALTITYSLICSLLMALTLMPMLASLPSKPQNKISSSTRALIVKSHKKIVQAIDTQMSILSTLYERLLFFFITNPRKLFIIGGAIVVLGFIATAFLDKELMPKVDAGEFSIEITSAPGTPLADTSSISARIESTLSTKPWVQHVYAKIGSDQEENITEKLLGKQSNYAKIKVILKDSRSIHVRDALAEIKNAIHTGEMVKVDFRMKEDVVESVLSTGTGLFNIELYGNDMTALHDFGNKIKSRLKFIKELSNVESNLDKGNPELKVAIDRIRMHSLGVSVASVASSVRAAIYGEVATAYREGDDEIDVRVRLNETDRSSIESLGAIMIKSEKESLLPLGKFVSLQEGYGTTRIVRSNQSRVNIITADVNGSRERALSKVSSILQELSTSQGIESRIGGESDEIKKTLPELIFAAALAILLVYMVLASQFQSLKTPFIIMCSIPLTLLGTSGALFITGKSLNINSGIGMILLCGTVVNNAIVLIDYIQLLLRNGNSLKTSIMQASRRRIRPIMMTTLTTILGMLPIALGFGEGSEIQQPLAIAVIGGLTVSTFLTLLFIPAIYYLMHLKSDTLGREYNQ
jgi:CzcA family heavy metal efflux pump